MQLLAKKLCRKIRNFQELRFCILKFRIRLKPGKLDARTSCKNAQRLRKLYAFDLFYKPKNISAQATTKAVPNLPLRRNYKRGSLFRVKRAESFEVLACLAELQIALQKLHQIKPLFYFLGRESHNST